MTEKKTSKEIFDSKYEYYRNMEGKPAIPLEARELIYAAMEAYASEQKPEMLEKMPTREEAKLQALKYEPVYKETLYMEGFMNGFIASWEWFRKQITERADNNK